MTSILLCVMRMIYYPLVVCGRKIKMWWPFGPSLVDGSAAFDGIAAVEGFPVRAERLPKNTGDTATQTDEAADGFTGKDNSTQTHRMVVTKDAWCQVDSKKPTENIQGTAAVGTAVRKPGTVAESLPPPPPPSRADKFSTHKSVVSYTANKSTLSSTVKYWKIRHSLFSRFDRGVMLDEESFRSVCPEMLAAHTARRCPYETVVDPFCGAGSNAIQLAMTCRKVIAVDVDPAKIKLARRNAAVYGVAGKIDFRVGDSFDVLSGTIAEAVITSPSWGSPHDIRDVCSRGKGGLAGVLEMARKIAPRVVIRLPKAINKTQCLNISRAKDFGRIEFESVTIDGCPDSVNLYLKTRQSDTRLPGPLIETNVSLDSGRWKYRPNGTDGLAGYSAYLNRTTKFLMRR